MATLLASEMRITLSEQNACAGTLGKKWTCSVGESSVCSLGDFSDNRRATGLASCFDCIPFVWLR